MTNLEELDVVVGEVHLGPVATGSNGDGVASILSEVTTTPKDRTSVMPSTNKDNQDKKFHLSENVRERGISPTQQHTDRVHKRLEMTNGHTNTTLSTKVTPMNGQHRHRHLKVVVTYSPATTNRSLRHKTTKRHGTAQN